MRTEEPEQFNDKHDNEYLAKVFGKFSTLGVDAEGETNAKRCLTKFNAKNAAREIIGTWKNLKGDELDAAVDSKFDSAWHNIDTTGKDTLDLKNAYAWIRQLVGEDQVPNFSGKKE